MSAQLEDLTNSIEATVEIADNTVASSDDIVAEIAAVKTGLSDFETFFQETAEDLIDVQAIANEVTALIDRFVDLISTTLRTDVGPCSLLSSAYDEIAASACEDGQESLDAYWFAIAMMTFAGFILIIATFKVSL